MALLRHSAPELVSAAEAKIRCEPVDPAVYVRGMAGLMDQPDGARLDVVVLGCTHFPLIEDELRAAAPHVEFVDGAAGIARRIHHLTKDQTWPADPEEGTFVTTAPVASLNTLLPALSGFSLTRISSL
jgi:glutamate racemase